MKKLREDPPFYSEGLDWVRIDLDPPVYRVYRGGKIYEHVYSSTVGESSSIDPMQEFPILAGADDQYVWNLSTTYPPGATGLSRPSSDSRVEVERTRGSTNYVIALGLLRFNTSALEDTATVSKGFLRLYVQSVDNVNNRSLRGEWYTWNETDTDYTSDGSVGTTAFEVPLSSLLISSNDIALSNLSFVNKTGVSYLRLHVTGDSPSGYNRVRFASYENSSQPEPTLLIET